MTASDSKRERELTFPVLQIIAQCKKLIPPLSSTMYKGQAGQSEWAGWEAAHPDPDLGELTHVLVLCRFRKGGRAGWIKGLRWSSVLR